MAYMSQDHKKRIKVELDKVLKGTGIKYSLGVRNHSTIVLNVKSGPVDFLGNYMAGLGDDTQKTITSMDVNVYHYQRHFSGEVLELMKKIMAAMNLENYDHSEPQQDYYNVGFYVDVNIGKWGKPYELVK
jgi:hypothetical protein